MPDNNSVLYTTVILQGGISLTEIVRKESFHSKGWHAIIAMLMVVGGSACFVLSCISAMLIMKKAD